MNNIEKKDELKNIISKTFSTIMSKKCILLDAPYYHNIGDVLIWKGEMTFLAEHNIQCLYNASYETCDFPKLTKDTTILFNGGGNLGDIYHEHMDFLLKIVRYYPNNRVIILPQTVYYADKSYMENDFRLLKQHKELYFCARDKVTYEMLSEYFGTSTFLLPDMAFCISKEDLHKYIREETKYKLIIERRDCESLDKIRNLSDGDISDWPTFEHSFHNTTFLNKILKKSLILIFHS